MIFPQEDNFQIEFSLLMTQRRLLSTARGIDYNTHAVSADSHNTFPQRSFTGKVSDYKDVRNSKLFGSSLFN